MIQNAKLTKNQTQIKGTAPHLFPSAPHFLYFGPQIHPPSHTRPPFCARQPAFHLPGHTNTPFCARGAPLSLPLSTSSRGKTTPLRPWHPTPAATTVPGIPKTGTPGTEKGKIMPGVPKNGTPGTHMPSHHPSPGTPPSPTAVAFFRLLWVFFIIDSY